MAGKWAREPEMSSGNRQGAGALSCRSGKLPGRRCRAARHAGDAEMTNTARFAAIASGLALTLALGACNKETTAEKQVEAQAEAIDKGYDADAKMVEASAKGTSAEDAAEKQA